MWGLYSGKISCASQSALIARKVILIPLQQNTDFPGYTYLINLNVFYWNPFEQEVIQKLSEYKFFIYTYTFRGAFIGGFKIRYNYIFCFAYLFV